MAVVFSITEAVRMAMRRQAVTKHSDENAAFLYAARSRFC